MTIKKRILIIIPVLNEQNNIIPLVKKIINQLKKYTNILFIDDNSIDKTRDKIYEAQNKYKNIYLIKRKSKLGIGSAHKCGIKWGYKKKFQLIITMDCDGTHNPIYLKKLISSLEKNEIITTNRFLKKNSLKGWSIWRVFLTRTSHFIIRNILNIKYDSSGGYRCYDVKKIRISDILLAKDNGYAFLWESIFILHKKKYKISEIPIILPSRASGTSKMGLKDIFYSVMYLIYIYFKN
jgi:dolichol-phosphate mannosyltransferase